MQASPASKGQKHKYVPTAKAKGGQAASFEAKDPMQSALSDVLMNKRPADFDDSDSEVELLQKKLKKLEEESDEDSDDEGDDSDDDSDDEGSDSEYEEPTKKGKETGRSTFGKALRIQVLSQAPQNKDGHHVCPPCGMPLMEENGVEIVTFQWIKPNAEKGRTGITKKYMVAGQLDHYPPWAGRYEKLIKRGATLEEIREDHDDPDQLRPLCLRCNTGHRFERVKKLPSYDYSNDQYESEDSERDEEIWEAHRK